MEMMNNNMFNNNGCPKDCPPTYTECKPIESCSIQVVNQYHITKQPYVHTFVTDRRIAVLFRFIYYKMIAHLAASSNRLEAW